MATFTVHTDDGAPEASKARLDITRNKFGFVPNLIRVLAESPQALEAYQVVADMFETSSLTNEERNVVWLAINVEHNCHYCVPAHTGIAKMTGMADDAIEILRSGGELPDPKLEALRQFTLKVIRQRGVVSEEDTEAFFAHGYDQRTVLDIILGTAQKVMSNYVNHFASTPVDEQFAQFAWEPRKEG